MTRLLRTRTYGTYLAIAVLLALPSSVEATMVVLLGTGELVVVAADSRQTGRNSSGDIVATVDTGCKISLDRQLVLATYGHTDGPSGSSGPGFHRFWQSVRGNGDSVEERVMRMAVYAQKLGIRIADADSQVNVLGLKDRAPDAGAFRVLFSESAPPSIVGPSDISGDPMVWAVGDSVTVTQEELEDIQVRLRGPITPDDIAAIAFSLIEREAVGNADVGGPIDIAVVDSSGARWLRVKPHCRLD